MRCFKNIATLIRTKRINHPKGYSQSELSHLLGYKNGQFISNVERALCNIPLKMLKRVSDVLGISSEDLKEAILKDHEETLNNYLKSGTGKVKNGLAAADSTTTEISTGTTSSTGTYGSY
jgi:transcriptional regulator with XRE-family HTH domain